MFGAVPKWDFFISYRVDANLPEARALYNLLTENGLNKNTFFDKECLPDGENWQNEFCKGLVNSRVFIPIVSEDAIKNPDRSWQNFESLLEDQANCDNVFLEHCLALELMQRGYIEKIFPVFIGKKQVDDDGTTITTTYVKINHRLEMPQNCPDKIIKVVQSKVSEHLDNSSLGCPYKQRTAAAVWAEISRRQGAEVEGASSIAFQDPVKRLLNLTKSASQLSPPSQDPAAFDCGSGIVATLTTELEEERALVAKLKDEVKDLQEQLSKRKGDTWQEPLQSFGTTTADDENDPDMLPKRPEPPQPRSSKACTLQ